MFHAPLDAGSMVDLLDGNDLLGSVKPSSYQTYCNQANRHLRPVLGGYFLSELTPGMIHAFVEELRASGLASGTVRGIYRLLSAAMRYALEEGVLRKIPVGRFECIWRNARSSGCSAVQNRKNSVEWPLRQTISLRC